MARTFVVARNPDPDSRLPYLIRLPLPHTELSLKAKDTWPRTAAVYCHRAEGWPADPDVSRRPVRRISLLAERLPRARMQATVQPSHRRCGVRLATRGERVQPFSDVAAVEVLVVPRYYPAAVGRGGRCCPR